MANPKINPAYLLSALENGYIVYDPVGDRLHELNPVGSLIAELCDGGRSLGDIREVVEPLLPAGGGAEIDRWIEEGLEAGLLVWSDGPATAHREFSAAELSDLAQRLRGKGKIEMAFLCRKRVVELMPDDADAWQSLGHSAQIARHRGEARAAYEKYLELRPDDAKVQHLLTALRDEAPPPRASNRTIEQIYESFAPGYEHRMREDLKYRAPERIEEAINSIIGDRGDLSILDIGCGSGLAGVVLKKRAARLVGIDLSPDMIELARARNIYDRLEIAEITDWLDETTLHFDLIVCCDCLIYFGDLNQLVRSAAKRLNPDGMFALTLELGDRYPFRLADTGRYSHHPDHVREASAAAGLAIASFEEGFLRMEFGEEVTGLYVVLNARSPQE